MSAQTPDMAGCMDSWYRRIRTPRWRDERGKDHLVEEGTQAWAEYMAAYDKNERLGDYKYHGDYE